MDFCSSHGYTGIHENTSEDFDINSVQVNILDKDRNFYTLTQSYDIYVKQRKGRKLCYPDLMYTLELLLFAWSHSYLYDQLIGSKFNAG